MIFKRKKKKLDPKVRFQQKNFTGQLKTARKYKRTSVVKDTGITSRVLSKIGLGTRARQIGLVLFIGLVVYLVYIPNFLTIKTISISGLSDSDRQRAVEVINQQIDSSSIFNPQHNLLFSSKTFVTEALLGLGGVQAVDTIKKDFRNNALVIKAEAKYTKFLVVTDTQVLDVYNDGQLRGPAGVTLTDWQAIENPNLVKILTEGNIDFDNSQVMVVDQTLVDKLVGLSDEMKNLDGYLITYFDLRPEEKISLALQDVNGQSIEVIEVDETSEDIQEINDDSSQTNQESTEKENPKINLPLSTIEIKLVLAKADNSVKPFNVYFDTQSEIQSTVQQLKLLLSQMDFERLKNLEYIDMRIEGKAYLCLRNTRCAK